MPRETADQPEKHWYPAEVRAAVGVLIAVGCGSVPNTTPDAPTGVDGVPGGPDGAPGPDARCVDTVILAGGSDPAAQGWTVEQAGFAELTYPDGQTTQLFTDSGGVEGGGTLVLRRDGAVTPDRAFIIEVVMRVVSTTNPHMGYDMPVGVMGSYSDYPGTVAERRQHVYVDPNQIGWTDDSESAPLATDAFHTYRLDVDQNGDAGLHVDGALVLQRTGYTTNGTIAVGDQTSRIFYEATTQIRSITKLCPP
jgi:hypothetical protein